MVIKPRTCKFGKAITAATSSSSTGQRASSPASQPDLLSSPPTLNSNRTGSVRPASLQNRSSRFASFRLSSECKKLKVLCNKLRFAALHVSDHVPFYRRKLTQRLKFHNTLFGIILSHIFARQLPWPRALLRRTVTW